MNDVDIVLCTHWKIMQTAVKTTNDPDIVKLTGAPPAMLCSKQYFATQFTQVQQVPSRTFLCHFFSFLVHAKHKVATAKVRPRVWVTTSSFSDLLIFLFTNTTTNKTFDVLFNIMQAVSLIYLPNQQTDLFQSLQFSELGSFLSLILSI